MKSRHTSMALSLFFEALPPRSTSVFSFPVLDERTLKTLFRHASVWILGDSPRMLDGLAKALHALRAVADSVVETGLSLERVDDHAKIAQLAGRIQTASANAYLMLAEDHYGANFARLCRLAPSGIPVLLPSGFLVPTWPGASLSPLHPEAATSRAPRAILESLQGQRVLVWATVEQFTYTLKPLFDAYGKDLNLIGLTHNSQNQWGAEHSGLTLSGPEHHAANTYDVLLSGMEGAVHTYKQAQVYAKPGTPFIVLNQQGLLSHIALLNNNASQHPAFFERTHYDPYLSYGKYAIVFQGHEHFSQAHFADVSTTRIPLSYKKNTYVHSDIAKPFFTITDGMRKTLGADTSRGQGLHLFGPSYVLCSLSDDAYTTASQLQKRCLDNRHDITVYNHGVAGDTLENTCRLVVNTTLKANDSVMLFPHHDAYDRCIDMLTFLADYCLSKQVHFAVFFQPSLLHVRNMSDYERMLLDEYQKLNGMLFSIDEAQRTHNDPGPVCAALKKRGIAAYPLQPFFDRPHSFNEVFVDYMHVTYKGNARIAEAMYDLHVKGCLEKPFSPPVVLATPPALPAEVRAEFIEHTKQRFMTNPPFIDWLRTVPRFQESMRVGAIAMNCNPFTRGHLHILERALKSVDRLYIFVVEEDISAFSFADRIALIHLGTQHLGERICVMPSGQFIISSFTFPEYFCKDTVEITPDTSLETALFGSLIAPALGIGTRFFGEEPYCRITRAYHEQLKETLTVCGVGYTEIPRATYAGEAISASRVRALLQEHKFEELAALVPASTFKYLTTGMQSPTIHTSAHRRNGGR